MAINDAAVWAHVWSVSPTIKHYNEKENICILFALNFYLISSPPNSREFTLYAFAFRKCPSISRAAFVESHTLPKTHTKNVNRPSTPAIIKETSKKSHVPSGATCLWMRPHQLLWSPTHQLQLPNGPKQKHLYSRGHEITRQICWPGMWLLFPQDLRRNGSMPEVQGRRGGLFN